MALATTKSVFLHTSKCGGMWVRNALNAAGLQPVEIGDQHDHFPLLLQHQPEKFFTDRLTWTTIRHPATWYQSRWAFRIKSGWHAKHPLDWNTASNNFHQFVENCLAYKPDGWCTWEYNQYINNQPGVVKFVGRMEHLVDDFLTAMKMAGEEINEKVIRSMRRVNTSAMDGKESGQLALYTPQLLDRVLAVENEVIQLYYRDYELDPKSLCL